MTQEKCVYDPLSLFMEHYAGESVRKEAAGDLASLPVEERLKRRIVDGDSIGLDKDLTEALQHHQPLDIINTILLDGMKTVGELFGSGQMQLPFVLLSAETMKRAVAFLEPFMDKAEGAHKGTIVLATVKGDVHDIGKNLVDIILTNNGYHVINLGIKVPIETMISAAAEHHAEAIGMSGLLVKSTVIMKENLELMQQRGLRLPVVLGGAALTRRYVEQDLRPLYDAEVAYARDAFDGLGFMERIMDKNRFPAEAGFPAPSDESEANEENLSGMEAKMRSAMLESEMTAERPAGASLEAAMQLNRKQETQADRRPTIGKNNGERPVFAVRSNVPVDVPIPPPPFFGSKIVKDVRIEKVFEYVNEAALIRGQWQVRRGKKTEEEYAAQLEREIHPILGELKLKIKRERILQPAVVYGFFPCNAHRDDLLVYKPRDLSGDALYQAWPRTDYAQDELEVWQTFHFPRQAEDRYLCIADFFRPAESGEVDVCAFHAVTMGAYASEYTAALFAENKYQEYLYMHGLSVECAEALAEYWHKAIREELGIAAGDAPDIKRLFSQGYQGSRYSFGYPACPHLEDQAQLFELLRPERIGIALTEEYQLVPEQTTTAIVVHHPSAKYFNIK